MAKLDLYGINGKIDGSVKASDRVFSAPLNEPIVTETLNWYLATRRQGSANTKTRAEVSGGGRKPWSQKGTGRARIGDNRAPHWRHGGVVFGPKPRDYSFNLPIKVRKAAIRIVLSDKAQSGKIKVVEKLSLTQAKTKEMAKLLEALGVKGSALIVISAPDVAIERASRNIKGIKVAAGRTLNVYDMLKHDEMIIIKDAMPVLEEAYA
ncbi:MAG: 50S ribosomal protein L4 [bacterium]